MRYVRAAVILAASVGWVCATRAAEPLPKPKGPVLLIVSGQIEQTNVGGEAQFDRDMLEELGKASISTMSITSARIQLFEGVPLRSIIERVGARGNAMRAQALNRYKITIPLEDLRFDPIVAMRVDGQVLKLRDKGPLWVVYPRDAHAALQTPVYDSRWIWQLHRLQIE